MTERELLDLIAQAKAEGWTELDLSGQELSSLPADLSELIQLEVLKLGYNQTTFCSNEMTALPENLAQLTNLHTLDLSGNKLTVLPEWLTQLTKLHTLDLSNNKLTELPEKLGQLAKLQMLDLNNNKLIKLPEDLERLTNLQSLDIRENSLTTLPEWLMQLTNLRLLGLSGNNLMPLPGWLAQLTTLRTLYISRMDLASLPEWLAQLTNLRSLYIRNNNLTMLPEWLAQLANLQTLYLNDNRLIALPDWLAASAKLPYLQNLYISKNPLSVPPPELLGEALTNNDVPADIIAIRAYFRQLQETSAVYFYEAKLLIIGEGGAGKTSLARKLLEPKQPLLAAEGSTEGIDVLTWQFPLPPHLPKQAEYNHYTANIWDFGGQEIYFATHQFFLTRRSVYLLVADTRRQHTDFYTWLRMQETFGDDSPVLLVKNRNRQQGNSFTIENLPQLRERFPNLQAVLEVDLNDVPQDQGWHELLQQVQKYLLALTHIGQPRPATWVAVRSALRSDARDIMPWAAFVALCQAQGMKRAEDIQQLGEYLHNLGDILYFHEDPVLRDYVIRNPTWGLAAVYKVLDNRAVEQALGQFTLAQLRDLWHEPIYAGYHLHLLRLMENFQLCYPLEGVKDTYIAPQLLTEAPPTYEWEGHENLQLRYVYPLFMPRGILSRLIVKLHRRIAAQRLVWRSGVILHDGYARAEVLELRGDQQIRIRVSGRNKRDLLMEIVRALDDLHLSFPKLRVERRIPCNCAACVVSREPHFFVLDKLLERLANRKETIECQNAPYHEVPIDGLLSEIGPWAGQSLGRWGANVHIAALYMGDRVDGDKIDGDKISVGDITEATNVAIGKEITSSVSPSGQPAR